MLLSPDFGVLCNHLPGVNDNINIINLMFHFPLIYIVFVWNTCKLPVYLLLFTYFDMFIYV